MKLILLIIISLNIAFADEESEILLNHYKVEISKHLENGNLSIAREEFENAKRLAPETLEGLKTLEQRIVKEEKKQQQKRQERLKAEAGRQKKNEMEEAARDEKAKQDKASAEIARKNAWKKSLPERRCACVDLSKYTKHLINEELSKPVFNKVTVYQNQNRAKSFDDAIKILDSKVSNKNCSNSVDLTATMGYEKRYDQWQSLMDKCDLNEILK